MPELAAAVTDTHALLFHAQGARRLGPRAAAHFRAADEGSALVYVPMAVLMEVTFLARVGRIDLRRQPAVFFDDLFLNPSFQAYDLTPEQVFAADQLRFNRDWFDALIVSAAHVLGLPLITRDTEIVESRSVKVIW